MAIIIGGQTIEGPEETINLDDFLEHVKDDAQQAHLPDAIVEAIEDVIDEFDD